MVYTVVANLPFSNDKLRELKDVTEKGTQMHVILVILAGVLARSQKPCCSPVQEYWNRDHQMAVTDQVVFRGDCIVIPKSLRTGMMPTLIHHGHMTKETYKQRARDTLFWPGMNAPMEETVAKCTICLENRMLSGKEPTIAHDVPDSRNHGLWVFANRHMVDCYNRLVPVGWRISHSWHYVKSWGKVVVLTQNVP